MKKLLASVIISGVFMMYGCYTPPPLPENLQPSKIEAAKSKALDAEKKVEEAKKKVEEKKTELEKKKNIVKEKEAEKKKVEDVMDKLNNGEM